MLPPVLVIDASVLVAAMRPGEPHFASARTVLERLTRQRSTLYLPTIGLAEVAAAIARGLGRADRAEKNVALVRQLPGMTIIAVDHPLGGRAAKVAGQHRIRGCDAIYVALAQSLDAPLLTLDQQQQERAPTELKTYTPTELIAD